MITYRPIITWPGVLTTGRKKSPFQSNLENSEKILRYEVGRLDGSQLVVQVALTEMDLRVDGRPKMRAEYAHPGVIVSFDSKHGSLQYATDVFTDWRANLRAVALGLEALRKVDRYGISKSGEQYTGWRQLESGFSKSEAERLIEFYGGRAAALKATHPDAGGDPEEFHRVQEALRVIGGES